MKAQECGEGINDMKLLVVLIGEMGAYKSVHELHTKVLQINSHDKVFKDYYGKGDLLVPSTSGSLHSGELNYDHLELEYAGFIKSCANGWEVTDMCLRKAEEIKQTCKDDPTLQKLLEIVEKCLGA
jgi:hypothetical protein